MEIKIPCLRKKMHAYLVYYHYPNRVGHITMHTTLKIRSQDIDMIKNEIKNANGKELGEPIIGNMMYLGKEKLK